MGIHDVKRKTGFHLKEKVLNARLSFMGVTLAQYLTERSTRGDHHWLPDPCAMDLISRAAYEVDDYWRVVKILHKRLSKFSEKKWRGSYKALILLDHLLLHGPLRAAEEFEDDVHIIIEMKSFQYVDHKGFDWGLSIRKKSGHVLKLIEDGSFLKNERDIARKVKIDRIKGAKSFIFWPSTTNKSWKIFEEEGYNSRSCIYHPVPSKCQYHEDVLELDLVDEEKTRIVVDRFEGRYNDQNSSVGVQDELWLNSIEEEIYHGGESPSNWISFEKELLFPGMNYEVFGKMSKE
ncbi:ENTH domain-containing protein C794.11c-like [Impatiens glandulifera]|uniref:ENTH domain-containing protein C794.11c-like n=1 Tax=Impatiens glandulifera TaxID=253017 RepID=UPI001FB0E597|nr:ENTH domain-containing protein C794.11c-like [Impatiens glandulifera]